MSNLERERSGAEEEEFRFLDVDEWDKVGVDWERRGQFISSGTDRAILRALLWFILIGGGIAAVLLLSPSLSSVEPTWKSLLPAHANYFFFVLFMVFLAMLAIRARRKYGKGLSRVEMDGARFNLVIKVTKELVRIPAERLKRVEVRKGPFSSSDMRITLVDGEGRKYTLEHLANGSRLVMFAEFCRRKDVEYWQGRDSLPWTVQGYCLGAILFLLWLAATEAGQRHTPMLILAALLLPRPFLVGRD
jgi:hypothetical protein